MSVGRMNLLDVKPVRALIRWRGFPYTFQAVLLAAFLALIYFSWQVYPEDSSGAYIKTFRKTNITTLLVWGVWLPLMMLVFAFLGRFWCTICPIELASDLAERLGRRLGIRQRRLAPWLRAGWLVTLLYLAAAVAVAGYSLHRLPWMTAGFLVALLGLAIGFGLLFRNRAFCRGVCPGLWLLKTYSRGALLALRPKPDGPCDGCVTRECTTQARRNRPDARSCPTLLNPARLDRNEDCQLCFQCVKACPHEGLRLSLHAPYAATDRRTPLASWALTAFVMVLSGWVSYELVSEWAPAKAVFMWPSNALARAVDVPSLAGPIVVLWKLVVFPLALWTALGLVARTAGGRGSLDAQWQTLALPLAIMLPAAHVAKAVAKFGTWAGFLPVAVSDPFGRTTAAGMLAGTLAKPGRLYPLWIAGVVGLVLLGLGLWWSMRQVRRVARPGFARGLYAALGLFAGAYLFVMAGWVWG